MSLIIFFFLLISLPTSISQTSPSPSPVSPPVSDSCNGIFISYMHTAGTRLPPSVTDLSRQPYSFKSTVTILNNGLEDLKAWKIFVGFQHDEYLVSATNAVLADGSSIPTNVGNGTVFAGFPTTDLKSAVETAGDYNQMGVEIELVGTQYGVADPDIPMPSNLSLAMDGFICPKPTLQGENVMHLCCLKDEDYKENITDEKFLPRQNGDLTIDYDVIRAYETDYHAHVKLSNHHPLGRLDNWKLSWDWMRDEFIYAMKGAHPSVANPSSCIYGRQGAYYKKLDFSNVLTCDRRPTILDLPPSKANDPVVGSVPFCCRNGTILPTSMDPSKSMSAFEVHVMKMPPDLNRTQLIPPQNWKISGRLNPDYECGPPVRVSPSPFPDQSGLPFNRTAVASWQVVCNITQAKKSSPQCCVSFSAFYNDSVIPCNTCACGCQNPQKRCDTTAPALLLPPESLLVPFANRTKKAIAWSNIKHRTLPRPLPCGDNCGVSINWHVHTDYRGGWSARVTLFNWGETDYADWFAAMQFKKAAPGFQKMYSFNGSTMLRPNNTIFMQGLEGLNYLVAEQDAANPSKDPLVPGKLQSVLSFTKKRTPGIDVAAGDGFPSKVFFNGEECSLPPVIPSYGVRRPFADLSISMVPIVLVVFLLIQQ